jgi:hypothetical protein
LEILELIHADAAPTLWEGAFLLDQNQSEFRLRPLVNLNNFEFIAYGALAASQQRDSQTPRSSSHHKNQNQ